MTFLFISCFAWFYFCTANYVNKISPSFHTRHDALCELEILFSTMKYIWCSFHDLRIWCFSFFEYGQDLRTKEIDVHFDKSVEVHSSQSNDALARKNMRPWQFWAARRGLPPSHFPSPISLTLITKACRIWSQVNF